MNINGILQVRATNAIRNASQDREVSSQRLATGRRINSAKDDAAGLAISVSMTSQIMGTRQALRNIGDGIALAQTAQDALSQMTEALQRMREIAVQSANGTYTDEQRGVLQQEMVGLRDTYMSIMLSTEFNGKPLMGSRTPLPAPLEGSVWGDAKITIQTGPASDDTIEGNFGLSFLPVFDVSSGNTSVINDIDEAIDDTVEIAAKYGAFHSRLESAAQAATNSMVNIADARSRISDARYDQETTDLAKSLILENAASAMMAQANMNMRNVIALLK